MQAVELDEVDGLGTSIRKEGVAPRRAADRDDHARTAHHTQVVAVVAHGFLFVLDFVRASRCSAALDATGVAELVTRV